MPYSRLTELVYIKVHLSLILYIELYNYLKILNQMTNNIFISL